MAVLTAGLAGCGRAAPAGAQDPPQPPVFSGALAASCVDPTPPPANPVAGPAGEATTNGRFARPLAIDGTAMSIAPPPSGAQTAVSASLAQCNLRAAYTAQNFPVEGEVRQSGLTFGLGLVTVRDNLLRGHTYLDSVSGAGPERGIALQPYNRRLAWIAIVDPVLLSSGGGSASSSSSGSSSSTSGSVSNQRSSGAAVHPSIPALSAADTSAYQVLVVDADTGSDGLLLSASLNGADHHVEAHLDALTEAEALPWQLVHRDPDGYSATLTVPLRACDPSDPIFLADRRHPDLVTAGIGRLIATCGPASPQPAQLHATTVDSTLPATLTHGPVGAEDTPYQS